MNLMDVLFAPAGADQVAASAVVWMLIVASVASFSLKWFRGDSDDV